MRNRNAFNTYCTHPFHTKKKVKVILTKLNLFREKKKTDKCMLDSLNPYDILFDEYAAAPPTKSHASSPQIVMIAPPTEFFLYNETSSWDGAREEEWEG